MRLTIDVDSQEGRVVEQVILLANVSDYATLADMIADEALVVV